MESFRICSTKDEIRRVSRHSDDCFCNEEEKKMAGEFYAVRNFYWDELFEGEVNSRLCRFLVVATNDRFPLALHTSTLLSRKTSFEHRSWNKRMKIVRRFVRLLVSLSSCFFLGSKFALGGELRRNVDVRLHVECQRCAGC